MKIKNRFLTIVLVGTFFYTTILAAEIQNNELPATPVLFNSALALGASIPDYFAIESYKLIRPNLMLKGFFSIPLIPFTLILTQEKEEDIVDTRLKIATPETKIKIKAHYKLNTGVDVLYFPFPESGFFWSLGGSFRSFTLRSSESAPLYICFVTKEIPCNKEKDFFSGLNNKVNVDVTVDGYAVSIRSGVGWIKKISEESFLNLNVFGLTYALHHKESINVTASSNLDPDSLSEDQSVSDTANQFIAKKEVKLNGKAKNMTSKFQRFPIPLIGLSIGYIF